MQMYLISDNIDTLTGMRLAGVDGVVVGNEASLKAEIEKVMQNKEIGILLISEKLSVLIPDTIKDIKLNRRCPVIVEIPDRHGRSHSADFITQYINEAVGLKI